MSSLIPKISIGQDLKKGNHFDCSSLTHTTSEIGYVSPTFSKNLVPKSKVRIGTRTGVRLSPLFVPTMGQIDVRHYHCFIPFSTLWTPFDAFLSRTNYTMPDGTTYQPLVCPSFSIGGLLGIIFGATGATDPHIVNMRNDLICRVYEIDTVNNAYVPVDDFTGFDGTFFTGSDLPYRPQCIVVDNGGVLEYCSVYADNSIVIQPVGDNWLEGKPVPTVSSCDFCVNASHGNKTYIIAYNFTGCLKRLRTIFMGLGYNFNPFDTTQVTLFKLLAFYKSYWTLFGVNRTFNFYNTNCYKLIKRLSESTDTILTINGTPISYGFLLSFVGDLTECTYTCPVDYFSSSDAITDRGGESNPTVTSEVARTGGFVGEVGGASQGLGSPVLASSGNLGGAPAYAFPLAQKIAMRLLRFVNKNSVVGRQISEILRTRYGFTDVHNTTHESVIRVGATSVPIQISAIYNQTGDSVDMPLGSYAGMGVGSRRSKNFTFTADEFGCLITLTAVVPKMGYFQGQLRENTDGVDSSFDFWTPEFDAIGWQSLRYNELVADRQHKFTAADVVGTNLGIFGYQPFYTHMKVGFNRVLGDISLPHLADSMLPYTLDRYFPDVDKYAHLGELRQVAPLPYNDPQTFRSGTQGNTNRIFSDVSESDDHVIMQIFFDVKMSAPMKSISTSYDTWDEESTHSVDVAHE